MTKLILQNSRVMNLILTALIGEDAIDHYISSPCEWIDGRHADVLYTPVTSPTDAFPPVIIEIQNVVDKPFIRRLIKYCGHIFDKYQVEPIALTICINTARREITKKLTETDKAPFIKRLPSDEWAQAHYFINETIIASSLQTPLLPMVAFAYVLTKQQVSLLGLEHRNDPTVQMLYSIMKETLDHEVHNEETTVNILLNVCNNNSNQFKRILEALETDGDAKRARLYADDGLLYAQTCIRKYSQTSSSTMPEPLALPQEVVEGSSSSSSSHQNPLREIEPEKRMTDMEWAKKFIEEYKAENKRMNWQICFAKGQEAGFFKNYTNAQSLKNTYNGLKPKQ